MSRPDARWLLPVLAVLTGSLVGCRPDLFTYYETTEGHRSGFDCHIQTPIQTIEYGGDSVIVHPEARVTFKKPLQTFRSTELFVRLLEGEGTVLRFRTTDFGDSVAPGVAIALGPKSSSLQIGTAPAKALAARLNANAIRVRVFDFTNSIRIMLDCDTVFEGKIKLPATDVFSVESVGNSEVSVRGVWSEVLRNRKESRFSPGTEAITGAPFRDDRKASLVPDR